MNRNPGIEPRLSSDFAMRVLAIADRQMATRRRQRQVTGITILCVGIAATAVWLDFTASQQGRAPERRPGFASAAAPQIAEQARSSPPDALSYFFPDAEPLARYAAEDAGDDSRVSAGGLFADDE